MELHKELVLTKFRRTVKWFVDHCIEKGITPDAIEIHTANPVGRDNMLGYLASWKRSHVSRNI